MPRGPKNKAIDKNRTDFGAVLGRCLQEMGISYTEFASQTGIFIQQLSNIINGTIAVTLKWVKTKKILETLESINPTIFKQFEADLIAALGEYTPRTKPIDPSRTDFGAVLGRCLHAMEMPYTDFANQIDIFLQRLSNIINGTITVSLTWVKTKKILETLESINPTIFKQFEAELKDAKSKLKLNSESTPKKPYLKKTVDINSTEITTEFYQAVHGFIQTHKQKNNETDENLRIKFRKAAQDHQISFVFIRSALPQFIESKELVNPNIADDVTLQVLLLAGEAFGEYTKRDKIYGQFAHLPAIKREEARLG
jgi:predicted transcriptional regulator